jgi:hypothetical protein
MRKLLLALGVLSLVLPKAAEAHFNLTMPPSIAKSTEGGKGAAPCGPDTGTTGTITPVTGGQALMINISETVPHPGFYRFALSTTSPPTFPADNVVKDSGGTVLTPTSTGNSATAEFEEPAVYPVIADHMFEHTGTAAQMFPSTSVPGQVIVPNMNCDKCALQVIEFMAQHASNGPSAGFFYHHCAFLKITADPSKPIFDPSASSGGAGGSGGTSGSTAGASGSPGAAGSSSASGGAAGAPSGTGGVAQSSAGAATTSAGSSAASAGAPATSAGSANASAGASAAGAPSAPAKDPADNGGGCSLSHRAAGSLPALSLLLGVFALGRRARRRRRG